MSRPSVKICRDCLPGALRSSTGVRNAAPLRGVVRERTYATQRGVSRTVANRSKPVIPAARAQGSQLPLRARRGMATASPRATTTEGENKDYVAPTEGPMKEYDTRVQEGRLRDDPYQRGRDDAIEKKEMQV